MSEVSPEILLQKPPGLLPDPVPDILHQQPVYSAAEAIANLEAQEGRPMPSRVITVEGRLIFGTYLAYLEDEHDKHARIVLPEDMFVDTLMLHLPGSMLIGSDVFFRGYGRLQGVLHSTAFGDLFGALLTRLSWLYLRLDEDDRAEDFPFEAQVRYFDPPESVYVEGVQHLTPQQVRQVSRLIANSTGNYTQRSVESYRELRSRLSDGSRHLIAEQVTPAQRDLIVRRLQVIGIESVIVEYSAQRRY